MTIILPLFCLLSGVSESVIAAGSSSSSISKPVSAREKRNKANVYFDKAERYQQQGKYKDASKQYKKAIKINPRLAEAHEYIGEAYAETSKIDLADHHLNILKTLDSREAEELAAFIAKVKDNG
ncbi:MAG: tetratricopeptide repeat protein [Desulfobulbaceae bacterium]|nr:tetratricopeptide repeat protein [Desulfobulbaceae bacterium]